MKKIKKPMFSELPMDSKYAKITAKRRMVMVTWWQCNGIEFFKDSAEAIHYYASLEYTSVMECDQNVEESMEFYRKALSLWDGKAPTDDQLSEHINACGDLYIYYLGSIENLMVSSSCFAEECRVSWLEEVMDIDDKESDRLSEVIGVEIPPEYRERFYTWALESLPDIVY